MAYSLGSLGQEETVSMDQVQITFEPLPRGNAGKGEKIFLALPCKPCHVGLDVGPAFPGEPSLV